MRTIARIEVFTKLSKAEEYVQTWTTSWNRKGYDLLILPAGKNAFKGRPSYFDIAIREKGF